MYAYVYEYVCNYIIMNLKYFSFFLPLRKLVRLRSSAWRRWHSCGERADLVMNSIVTWNKYIN